MIFFFGVFFAFSYFNNSKTIRFFEIFLAITLGIQAIYTLPSFISNAGFARQMYETTKGAWAFGNPGFYSMIVILLPIIIMRGFIEKGLLRYILLVASIAIGMLASISSFGTPLGLLIAGVIIIGVLSIFTSFTGLSIFRVILINTLLALTLVLGYNYIFENPLLIAASSRIENAYNDPISGGYSGQYRNGSRVYLAEKSLDEFIENPLFGAGGGTVNKNPKLGGHSSFFDMLGAYGLLGGGALGYIGVVVIILIYTGKNYFKKLDWESLMRFTTIILYVIVGIVNPYWEGLGFVIVFIVTHPYKSLGNIT
jgi:hypothetical protein